jgi:hypothetical protein
MKLCVDAEMPEDVQGLWCRQSRLAGVVRFIIFSGALAVPAIVGWTSHHPWVLWIGIAVAVAIVPWLLMDVRKLFRATNWLLRIDSDGVWINLRSYRDKVSDVASVVHLDYAEIASVGRHTESYSTPSKMATGPGSYGAVGGSTIWRDEYLEFQLNHDQTDELKTALNNLRHPAEPEQVQSWQVRSRHFPVWLVSPAVIRVGWVSGHGHAVLPRMATALARLDGNVPVTEPTRRERPDWRKLKAEEVDELAGGISHAEAMTQVQRFEEDTVESAEPPK